MPRKPNYGFDKRKKEQDRKAKKDAKLAERQRRREAGEDPDVADLVDLGVNLPPQPGGEES